jgi:hypothetical protein
MPDLADAERHPLGARQPLELLNIGHARAPWRSPRSIGRGRRNSAILRRLCNLAPTRRLATPLPNSAVI